jgi:hypothetical protein
MELSRTEYGVDADSLTAKDLFQKQIRYVIPTFQRPYIWTQDDQWEPFWEDVQHAADRFLEELDPAVPEDSRAAVAELRAGRHFLGAVVVKQRRTATANVETREVIDGQQRLTTMQLLLNSAHRVAESEGWEDVALELEDLVRNSERYGRRDPDLVFKLWPTTTDQDAFRAVMNGDGGASGYRTYQVARAHEYFQLRIRDWIDRGEGAQGRLSRMEALQTALMGLLEIVVIDLGGSDDAFVIFETLNARGTPLLASDLVKNYLLQAASKLGEPSDDVSRDYWSQFDDSWWRREVRQGRLRRPRIDTFLDYWLEARTGEEVASHEVFPTFRKLVEEEPAAVLDVAASMREMAGVYRQLEDLDPYTRDGTFIYRWEVIDARVLTPLLLWVFSWGPDELEPERRTSLLVAIESYLVRRMINRLTTKQYNLMFLDLLKVLVAAGPAAADEVVIGFLARQTAESRAWPTDADLRQAMLDLPAYKLLSRGRLRMALEALEDDHRGPRSEDEFVTRGRLTVEHVMPQAWEAQWPLPPSDEPLRDELDRNRLIHTFGNLTLATSSLNSTMSNHSWDDKREHLTENSVLHLNKRVLARAEEAEAWNEDTIRTRGEELFERARSIWPRPD